ncbi:MAG: type IV pilus modification protein PilV, partial [Motiliproteus sp.]
SEITMKQQGPNNHGFTLIEVLISLLIFGVGIIGVTALTTQSQKITYQAYQSMVATWQLHDMMELIRANASQASGSNKYVHSYQGTEARGTKDCIANECSASEMADYDIRLWLSGTSNALPSAEGTVSRAASAYTLTLYWDGKQTGSTATPETDCGDETTLLCQKFEFEL